MRAMVLAAGLGTRLRPITFDMPKPMVPVLNRPVMEHILRLLGAPRLRGDDRQPALVPGADREPLRRRLRAVGSKLSYSREEALLGTSGGVRNVADFLGDELPGDLRRRAHRHRPDRDARVPRGPRRDRHAGHQAGHRHQPVRGRDHRLRRPDRRLPGEAGARAKRSPTSPTAGSTCSAGDLRLLPGAGDQQGCLAGRPGRLRRLGDGRLPAPAGERRALLLARDRLLLERHRQPGGAAQGQLRRADRGGRGRASGEDRRRLPQRRAAGTRASSAGPSCSAPIARSATTCGSTARR